MEEKHLNIDEIVDESIDDLRETARQTIIRKGKTHGTVIADKDRISQVVSNLLSNAIKYSPRADEIIVTTSSDKNKVIVSIQDFGIGIAKEFHGKIFQRFFRVTGADEKTFPGMGIGLHICKEIISRHGGEMWVESEKGKGATFSFSLPIGSTQKKK